MIRWSTKRQNKCLSVHKRQWMMIRWRWWICWNGMIISIDSVSLLPLRSSTWSILVHRAEGLFFISMSLELFGHAVFLSHSLSIGSELI
jgi:hypothetical protein